MSDQHRRNYGKGADAERQGRRERRHRNTTPSPDCNDLADQEMMRAVPTTPSEAFQMEHDPRYTFIDYVAPSNPIPPPAKYKLWFLILVLVYFAEWFALEAEYTSWLIRTFRLSADGATFLTLGTVVFVLSYAALDVVVQVVKVKIGEREYGVAAWLKQPRIEWVHEYENFPVQFLRRIALLLEDGYAIFTPKQPTSSSTDKNNRNSKKNVHGAFDYPAASSSASSDNHDEDDQNHDVVLKIQNHVRPDKLEEYRQWKFNFHKQVLGSHYHHGNGTEHEDKSASYSSHPYYFRRGLKQVQNVVNDDDNIHISYLTFDSIDHLNDYMTSPVRNRFVRALAPLVVTPTSFQLVQERQLPDAFTDLLIEQGSSVPDRPPKKWKVWFLTTAALFFVISFTRSVLPEYYGFWWGRDDDEESIHPRLEAFVTVLFNTYLNTYVMLPLLTMLFGHWLYRGPEESDHDDEKMEPWRTLNDGFSNIWWKVVISFGFYVGCGLAWFLKST